ncbi:MAG: hypothetical protein AAFO84_10675, partial [Cyanobacteria bacterium J06598_1]
MVSTVSNDNINALKKLNTSLDLLERLENKFKASFSPRRKNYQTRLTKLTERLESIDYPDNAMGRELSARIQSTLGNLADNADTFDMQPAPGFSGPRFSARSSVRANRRPNFSKDIKGLRRLAKRLASDSGALTPDTSGLNTLGSDTLAN